MTLLHIIDTLCDVTTKQADLLRELVTDLEHMNQVSEEVKNYYREKLDSIDQEMNVAEYGCRELPYMDTAGLIHNLIALQTFTATILYMEFRG